MKILYGWIKKHKLKFALLMLIVIPFCSIVLSLITMLGVKLCGIEKIIVFSDIVSLYGIIISSTATVIAVIITIDITLKQNTKQQHERYMPILAYEPISDNIDIESLKNISQVINLEISSDCVKQVENCNPSYRKDSFYITNFGYGAAINIVTFLKKDKKDLITNEVTIFSLFPTEKNVISFSVSDEIKEDTNYSLILRCRNILGQHVEFKTNYRVYSDEVGKQYISIRPMPTVEIVKNRYEITEKATYINAFFKPKIRKTKIKKRVYTQEPMHDIFK